MIAERVVLDITKAQSIPGWMNDAELLWLAFQAKHHSAIAEIGSFLGRSTRAIADNSEGYVLAVDLWQNAPEYKALSGDMTDDEIYQKFQDNTKGTNTPVYSQRMSSLEAAGMLKGLTFDMVFIDGAHDYESVKADIEAWRPLVKTGGILCGHDFRAEFPGLTQAVLELEPRAQLVTAYSSIWGVEI